MTSDINAKFRDEFMETCRRLFINAGFQSPRKLTINLKLKTDFYGWVGLNHGLYNDCIIINPLVGIHVESIQRMLDNEQGRKYRKGASATISIRMGELTPNEKAFRINRENKDLEAARLVDLIVCEGVPWMHNHSSYNALLPNLEQKIDMLGGNPEKYAATLSALGRIKEMRQFIDRIDESYYHDNKINLFSENLKETLGY